MSNVHEDILHLVALQAFQASEKLFQLLEGEFKGQKVTLPDMDRSTVKALDDSLKQSEHLLGQSREALRYLYE